PRAEQIFNLQATDVGRPLSGLKSTLDFSGLEMLVREVIDTVSLREREVQDREGRWFSLRVRPYLTVDNKIDGAVLVLTDIDALKRSEQEIKAARDYARAILRTAPYPLLVLRTDLVVDSANEVFYQVFNVAPADTEGRLIYEVGNRQWNIPKLRELLEDIIPRNASFDGFEVTHEFEAIGRRTMLLNARRLDSEAGSPERILFAIEDITARKQAEAALRVHTEELARFNRAMVGRESRMIELKKEVNDLCQQRGEAARYPLEFEQDGKESPAPPPPRIQP
ncbi:MAG: PAS domain-containing protein, partial [Opitutaceae bacterium]